MKVDKRLKKLIDSMVKGSLTMKGQVENAKVRKFIGTLSKLPKQNAIFAMSDYSKKLKRHMAAHTLVIETATKLSPIQIKRITNAFKADYQIMEVKTKLNPALLGGIKVKLGDKVFEDSIISKIEQIKESITS